MSVSQYWLSDKHLKKLLGQPQYSQSSQQNVNTKINIVFITIGFKLNISLYCLKECMRNANTFTVSSNKSDLLKVYWTFFT